MEENKQELIEKLVSQLTRKQKRKILRDKGVSYTKYVYSRFKDVKIEETSN